VAQIDKQAVRRLSTTSGWTGCLSFISHLRHSRHDFFDTVLRPVGGWGVERWVRRRSDSENADLGLQDAPI